MHQKPSSLHHTTPPPHHRTTISPGAGFRHLHTMRLNEFVEANANGSWGYIGMALSCDGLTFSSLTKLTKMRIEYENRPSDVPVDGLAVRVNACARRSDVCSTELESQHPIYATWHSGIPVSRTGYL
jgi:hypothetical protein